MKRILGVMLCFLFLALGLPAESFTFDAYINSVSGGISGFGFGLFPLGTTFGFEKHFQMIPLTHKAELQVEFSFAFNNNSLSTDYDYLTGRPVWALEKDEEENFFGDEDWDSSLSYFNPRASIDIYLDQGFFENPLSPGDSLFNIRAGYNGRYAMSLEEVIYSLPDHGGLSTPIFVYEDGSPKPPFDSELPAYPWLNGSRHVFSDYLYLQFSLNMDRDTPTDSEPEEGLGADLLFEVGPSWLFNNITPEGVQSDYYKISLYVEEKMEVFSIEQDNGWNWINMYVGHSNRLEYIGGSVVPENKLPLDRLRGSLQDRIWLHFTGPQFMAGDCFTSIELNLYNRLLFGGVVNEVDGKTKAVELQSSFSATMQLRLFGFIRLEYQVGYDFVKGIWPEKPSWWQNSGIQFYVSI